MKNEDVCSHFGKILKTTSVIYGNPIEISMIRKNQLCKFKAAKRFLGHLVVFVNTDGQKNGNIFIE